MSDENVINQDHSIIFCVYKHHHLPFQAFFYYKVNLLSPLAAKNFPSFTWTFHTVSLFNPLIMDLSSVCMAPFLFTFPACMYLCEHTRTNTHYTHSVRTHAVLVNITGFSNIHGISEVSVKNWCPLSTSSPQIILHLVHMLFP